MKNKKLVSVVGLFLFALTLFAQNPEMRRERMEQKREQIDAQRAAFITTRIELTTKQSEQFWPVYNQMQDEMRNLKQELRKELKEMGKVEEMSDAQVVKMLKTKLDLEAAEVELKRKYNDKFLKLIDAKQVAKLYKAEQEFKKEVLREIKERREHMDRRREMR